MRTLYSLILRKFLTASLVPILIVELSLVLTLFLLNRYQAHENRDQLRQIATSTFEEILDKSATNISMTIRRAQDDLMQIKTYTELVFGQKESFQNPHLALMQSGSFFRNDLEGKATLYTTNLATLDAGAQGVMERLSLLVPLLEQSIHAHGDMVHVAWININKYFAAHYPPIRVEEEIPEDLDVTLYPFYAKADPQNNPSREMLFLDIYRESWALALGEIGAFIAPLWVQDRFIGVVGVNLTVQTLAQRITQIDLPFNSFAMLLDSRNNLLVSSDEEKSMAEFGKASFYRIHQQNPSEPPNLDEVLRIDLKEDERRIIHTRVIPGTDLKIVLCAQKARVYGHVERVFEKSKQVGYWAIALIALFYTFFFLVRLREMRKLADYLAARLRAIVSFSHGLGVAKAPVLDRCDIQEFGQLNENLLRVHHKLQEMLIRDDLTELPNRRKLLLDLGERGAKTLLITDVNQFQHINDVYGAHGGDFLLRVLAQRLREEFSEASGVYRVGPDQFAVVLAQESHHKEALQERLGRVGRDAVAFEGVEMSVALTSGLSGAPEGGSGLFKEAQIALAEAKLKERGGIVRYAPELETNQAYEKNLLWGNKTRLALQEGRIVPYFQPILSLATGRVEKFESLVRMLEGDKVVSPFFFLEPARKTGVLKEITKSMVAQVCAVASRYPGVDFSINISFSDLLDDAMLPFIREQLDRYGVAPERIVFEVLETESLGDEHRVLEGLCLLKRVGCKIAIDDFGSGYSNFGHLLKIHVDFIKIDGQFIKGLPEDENSRSIARTVAEFSRLIGTQSVAEFVESHKVLDAVRELGIHYAQGYVLSPPLPESELAAWVGREVS